VPTFSNLLLDQIPLNRLLPSLRCSHQLGAPRDRLIATLPLTPDHVWTRGTIPLPRDLRDIARPDPLPIGKRDHLDINNGLLLPDNSIVGGPDLPQALPRDTILS
jgi:hypothetical protein